MANSFTEGNPREFEHYVPTTTDPGWSFTILTIIACMLLNLLLPVLVRRFNQKKKTQAFLKGESTHGKDQAEVSSVAPASVISGASYSDARSQVSLESSASVLSDILTNVLEAKKKVKRNRRINHRTPVASPQNPKAIERQPSTEKADDDKDDVSSICDKSVLSALTSDAVGIDDALDARDGVAPSARFLEEENKSDKIRERILKIVDYDVETHRLVKLFLPYAVQGVIGGVFAMVDVAIIGYMLGVQAANIWVVIGILMEFTEVLTYGFSSGEFFMS